MGPRVIGLAAFQLNFVIATFFASTQGPGSISAVNYAWLIVMMPLGLFGMAISTAVFPRMAEQATRDEDELRATTSTSLRLILYFTIPASVGLCILARPITAFLLESGAFNASSMSLVAGVLALYAIALFAHGGIEILSRGFYAVSDTRTPVTFAVISMIANIVLCFVLIAPFGIQDLAAALSVATIIEFALLLRTLTQRLGGLDTGHLVYSVQPHRGREHPHGRGHPPLPRAAALRGPARPVRQDRCRARRDRRVGLGVLVFYVTTRLLRSEEADTLARRLPLPAVFRPGTP
jgi:putative peptidoglycan lipid II flippase